MDKKRKPKASRSNVRWVTKYQVWHSRAKRFIRRADGKPFVFPVRGPR